jgi:hypothetical protein
VWRALQDDIGYLFLEWIVGKTFSYDALDDEDFVGEDLTDNGRNTQDKHKRKVKKRLDDYLEQKRLRKNLGEDDFDYLDDY